jgi:two-component system, OmpR family, phosphate regulon sensor histidine kinase PhoR
MYSNTNVVNMTISKIKNGIEDNYQQIYLKKFEKIIFDNFPGGIIIINKNGNIISANKIYKDFFKIVDHENIFENMFYVEKDLFEDFQKLLSKGISFKKESCYAVNPQGESKYLKIISFPLIDENKEIKGAISLFIDNTEAFVFKDKLIKLNSDIEEIVKQRTEELDRVNAELKEVSESKSIFMADVSHEFRTSLTIIQCSLEILSKREDIKEENLELFNNMLTEVKRVSGTLSDLSLLNRTDISNIKSHHKIINISSIIESICKELKVVADAKNINIEYKLSKVPIEMLADKEDIERLLLNLIRNAIKYNSENGWVKVSVEKKNKGIYLHVEDNGVGIPKKEIPNIFERFYRIDKSRTRKIGGSGLGLAICKHVVEIYDGTISVKSKVGSGSKFTVFFPQNK